MSGSRHSQRHRLEIVTEADLCDPAMDPARSSADTELTGSTGFAVLGPRQARHMEVVHLSATDPENIAHLANLADGATYPAARSEVVRDTEVVIPPDSVLIRFSERISSFFGRMETVRREVRVPAQARDLLLPKLISGEIGLLDADKVVEAVA